MVSNIIQPTTCSCNLCSCMPRPIFIPFHLPKRRLSTTKDKENTAKSSWPTLPIPNHRYEHTSVGAEGDSLMLPKPRAVTLLLVHGAMIGRQALGLPRCPASDSRWLVAAHHPHISIGTLRSALQTDPPVASVSRPTASGALYFKSAV